jgi:hypothetical protein
VRTDRQAQDLVDDPKLKCTVSEQCRTNKRVPLQRLHQGGESKRRVRRHPLAALRFNNSMRCSEIR